MNHKKLFFAISLALSVFFLVSCSQSQKAASDYGRYLTNPVPDTDGIIKILVYYDMEGISGQNDIRSLYFGNEEYNQVREWLTNDVNAVLEGLFSGGADEVYIVDAHGSGNPEPDILVDKMDKRASLVSRDEPFEAYVELTDEAVYDGVAVVCMHSKTGGSGFAAHTYTVGMDWILNDMSINETEIIAYSWGRVDVPVIFASGDDKLEEQLEWMDWLEYVKVKIAKGAGDADLISFEEVHKDMREAAERAVKNIRDSKAVHLTQPIKAQLRTVYPARLDYLDGIPGIKYEDQTVTFTAENFQKAYDGMTALVKVATHGYRRILNAIIKKQERGNDIFNEYGNKLNSVWIEVESGLWEPPSSHTKQEAKTKYFGYR